MRDPEQPQAPAASGEGSDASPSETLALQRAPATELSIAPRRAGFDAKTLARRALAGAAIAGFTELALGRRLYYAYEALRHTVTWLAKPEAPAQPAPQQQQPATRPPPEFPTPQQVMEDAIQNLFDAGKRAIERRKPMIDRARKRALARLRQPGIGAAVVGGATLGAVASIGVLPTLVGAGAAYLAHRKQRRATDSQARSAAR